MENLKLSYYTIPVKLEDEENKYLLIDVDCNIIILSNIK